MATADETSNDSGLADLTVKVPGGEIQFDLAEELLGVSGKVTVMVELKDDPVAAVKAGKSGEFTATWGEKTENELLGAQDKVATTIEVEGGAAESKIQSAFNGMRVTIDSSELENLESLPEVKAIYFVPTYERGNVHGVPMIEAPKVREDVGDAIGYTGEGVKVAVIDTGIDYTRATFNGPGTVEVFNKESVTETPNSEWFGPNTPRVKGGVDLVGDEYNGTNTPTPDDNPIDYAKAGRGTHITGTVGGVGVSADGETYTGAYDQKTHENEFKVRPGVAPKVELYVVCVSGCTRPTGMTTETVNWTVKNKMDVISMLLGTPYDRRSDADAVVSSNAVAAGVAVLASAGSYGSQPYLTGSSASGVGVIPAATSNPMENYSGVQSTVDGKSVQAMNVNNAKLPADVSVHVLKDVSGNVSLDHADSDYANVPKGSTVITAQGNCARAARAVFGQKHKAAAVVMINPSDDYASYEGKITGNPSTGEQLDVTILFLAVKHSDGAALVVTDGKQVTFAANTVPSPDFTKCGDFTSAGSRSGDPALRPGVAAPGVPITSVRADSGNDSSTLSGTSMAVPHATSVAVLTKQAHPSWSSQEISAAIVPTADASKVSGYGPTRGGGPMDLMDFTTTQVFVYGDSSEVKDKTVCDALFSFGYQEPNGSFEVTKTITLMNKGNSEVTFNGEVKASSQSLPAQAKLSTNKVIIPADGTADVTVTLTMKASDVPNSLKSQNLQNFYEASGNVQFTSGDKTLSIPYLMVPRSIIKVTGEISSDSSKIGFQNWGGTYDASGFLFNWGVTDPKGDPPTEAIEVGDGVDIVNVGVAITMFDGEKALVFVTNSHTRHLNVAGNSYQTPIDNNNDGKTDYIMFSADSGKRRLKVYNGVPEVFIYDMATKMGVSVGSYTLVPNDSSTMLLTAKASSVGVTGRFQYGAVTYGSNAQAKDAIGGTVTYGPENRPFNSGQSFQMPAGGSKDMSVTYNKIVANDQKSLGWMAVVFDNDQGTPEAATDSLTGGGTSPTVSPTIPNPTVTPTNSNPTGSVSPGDPSAPVSPVPTRAPFRPGLPKTGDLG